MRYLIEIPDLIEDKLRRHLFQGELEQGAFLFADAIRNQDELHMKVRDVYLIPPEGWQVQLEVYLEMTDEERGKVMKIARDGDFAVVDCHSHPGSDDGVWFSPSDISGITEFAGYVRWKLGGKPYAAMVWGESSLDAVIWEGEFLIAHPVQEVLVTGSKIASWIPRGTWFRESKPYWIDEDYGK